MISFILDCLRRLLFIPYSLFYLLAILAFCPILFIVFLIHGDAAVKGFAFLYIDFLDKNKLINWIKK